MNKDDNMEFSRFFLGIMNAIDDMDDAELRQIILRARIAMSLRETERTITQANASSGSSVR